MYGEMVHSLSLKSLVHARIHTHTTEKSGKYVRCIWFVRPFVPPNVKLQCEPLLFMYLLFCFIKMKCCCYFVCCSSCTEHYFPSSVRQNRIAIIHLKCFIFRKDDTIQYAIKTIERRKNTHTHTGTRRTKKAQHWRKQCDRYIWSEAFTVLNVGVNVKDLEYEISSHYKRSFIPFVLMMFRLFFDS